MRMLNKISNKLYPKGGVPSRYEVKKRPVRRRPVFPHFQVNLNIREPFSLGYRY